MNEKKKSFRPDDSSISPRALGRYPSDGRGRWSSREEPAISRRVRGRKKKKGEGKGSSVQPRFLPHHPLFII